MMEHPVLRPEFSEEEVQTGCEIAKQYRIAAVTVLAVSAFFATSTHTTFADERDFTINNNS